MVALIALGLSNEEISRRIYISPATGTLCAIDAPTLTATIPVALIRRRNAFQTGAARALSAALSDWPHKPGTHAHP